MVLFFNRKGQRRNTKRQSKDNRWRDGKLKRSFSASSRASSSSDTRSTATNHTAQSSPLLGSTAHGEQQEHEPLHFQQQQQQDQPRERRRRLRKRVRFDKVSVFKIPSSTALDYVETWYSGDDLERMLNEARFAVKLHRGSDEISEESQDQYPIRGLEWLMLPNYSDIGSAAEKSRQAVFDEQTRPVYANEKSRKVPNLATRVASAYTIYTQSSRMHSRLLGLSDELAIFASGADSSSDDDESSKHATDSKMGLPSLGEEEDDGMDDDASQSSYPVDVLEQEDSPSCATQEEETTSSVTVQTMDDDMVPPLEEMQAAPLQEPEHNDDARQAPEHHYDDNDGNLTAYQGASKRLHAEAASPQPVLQRKAGQLVAHQDEQQQDEASVSSFCDASERAKEVPDMDAFLDDSVRDQTLAAAQAKPQQQEPTAQETKRKQEVSFQPPMQYTAALKYVAARNRAQQQQQLQARQEQPQEDAAVLRLSGTKARLLPTLQEASIEGSLRSVSSSKTDTSATATTCLPCQCPDCKAKRGERIDDGFTVQERAMMLIINLLNLQGLNVFFLVCILLDECLFRLPPGPVV